jgi:eukaryotic-like serine/threonine-protein kinase
MTSDRWRQSEALYHAALALPKGERTAFLAEACADDDGMRCDVESLLTQLTSEDEFLCQPPYVIAELVAGHPEPIAMAGRALGTYQLSDLLGAGGMGEVYRARDATLNRDVAIKVLPPAFTSSPARLARFEREAQILASLNHPHICAIYGVDEVDGRRFLVLELVEGKTLAATLAATSRRPSERGRLSLTDALAVAQQIAAAFEAAHDRGIVHRDLKPANIIITPDGVAKVLDFGLAKTGASDGVPDEDGAAPEADATLVGMLIGTAAYMSPEQASGKAVDRRTDIWAFGVVLFEMVTGQRPFGGKSVAELHAAVLKNEPDWSALPAAAPPDVRRLLRQCLQKDPKRRLQSMGDARVQIEDLLSGGSDQSVVAPQPRRLVLPWLVAGTLALGLGGALAWRQQPLPHPVTRLGLALPSGQQLDGSGGGHIVALSPDGGRIAFVGSPPAIYLRSLSSDEVKAIPGTEGHGSVREPVFSPDGSEIAFYALADQTLKRIAVDGSGVAVTICPARTPYGMSWSADGIVFGRGPEGIMRVSPDGGAPVRIVSVNHDEVAHGPQLLPGGEQVLFTLATGDAADRWDALSCSRSNRENGPPSSQAEATRAMSRAATYCTPSAAEYSPSRSTNAVSRSSAIRSRSSKA